MVKRLLSVILLAGALVGMSIPVGAVDLEGTASVNIWSANSSSVDDGGTYDITFPRSATSTAIASNPNNYYGYAFGSVNISPTMQLNASGAIGVYFSYFVKGTASPSKVADYRVGKTLSTKAEYVNLLTTSSNWELTVYDANGELGPCPGRVFSITSFTPGDAASYACSPGITVSCKFSVDAPITGLYIEPLVYCSCSPNGYAAGNSNTRNFIVPSFTVIASESVPDLEALENIADQIAEGNAIATAMYGDIMQALNSIKGDTAQTVAYLKDALTALNSINTHAANIYNLCDAYLQYLVYINNTATSIDTELKAYHEDFMSMITMLNGTIVEESGNLQEKMEEIYNLLIAYLDSQYASAVNPDLIESTGNTQLDINRQEELEVGFQSNLTESWTDLKLETFALGGGYTSAVAWVSSWFSNFYNAMGDYGMILLLPLYIGIVTLVAGLARQAIRRSGRADRSRGGKKDA